MLVAAPSYLDNAGRPKRPAQLAAHAALLYALSPTGARWQLTRGSCTETVRMHARLQVNSSLALLHAARDGMGIARMPTFAVGDDLATGRLERVLPAWSFPDQGIFAVTATRDVPRKTRAFVDFLRERIGATPYWKRAKLS